ncbi:MAG: DNA-directed RNA polymerase subunit beta' [Candidatus Margulisbacteria bacterium]|nr:DNA-directed RNA polymerase subunit beta' [Candidatus Margulisiibacteriota bacterium]
MLSKSYDEFKKIKITLTSPERVRAWSHGEVTKPETINYRTFRPERNGLFCERIFGPVKDWECACGKYRRVRYRGIVCERCGVEVTHSKVRRERMGHIELAAPVSHIWYLKGVPSYMGVLLDMTVKGLEEVIYYDSYIITEVSTELEAILEEKQRLSEQKYLELKEKYGEKFKADIGARAIKTLLKKINLQELLEQLKEEIKTASAQKKLKLTKRYRVVDSFLDSGNRPDWMIMDVIPVMPPDLRPMVQLEGGRFATSDLNDLYRRVINRNNRLKRLLDIGAPNMIVKNEMRMLQEAVDVLLNNGRRGRVVTGSNGRPLKSLSDIIQGKQGRFRQNLLGKRVDYSGRSVIVVGPHLKLHQCGVPKTMALELFKPFVIRKLVEKGFVQNVKSAKRKIERSDIEVWDVLEEIIDGHPVMLNRAPTLHRLGIQAFEPVLVEGKAIQLHPLVCSAFNADFDGDQMAIHIPLSLEAQAEARLLMLANNNILAPANGRPVITPSQDMVLGIYYLTVMDSTLKENPKRMFTDFDEVMRAYETNQIQIHDKIKVRHNAEIIATSVGRVILNMAIGDAISKQGLPEQKFINEPLGKKQLSALMLDWFFRFGNEMTAILADEMKDIGFKYATKAGISISIEDLTVPPTKKDIIEKAYDEIDQIETLFEKGIIANDEKRLRELEVWRATGEKVTEAMKGNFSELNNVFMMASSGARGSIDQVKQLAGMRGLMADASGNTVDIPIITNFREGLNSTEYFISTYGARKGLVDTALRTADSGYLTRRLVDIAQDIMITEDDCKTSNGVRVTAIKEGYDEVISLKERLTGRVSLEKITDAKGNVIVDVDQTITEEMANGIIKEGKEEMQVRSVITCEAKRGLCQKCYGRDLSSDHIIDTGEAVGIIAAQSIGEPGTQLTMRTFHTGGVDLSRSIKVEIKADMAGTVSISKNLIVHEVHNEYGNVVEVVVRDGEITVKSKEGDQKKYMISQGSELRVKKGQKVEKGTVLFGHDSTVDYLVSSVSGELRLTGDVKLMPNKVGKHIVNYVVKNEGDIILVNKKKLEKVSIGAEEKVKVKEGQIVKIGDNLTNKKESKVAGIIASVASELITIMQANTYHCSEGALLFVNSGDTIKENQIIRKEKRFNQGGKARDIVAGLPKVEALFESRISKNKATLAEIDGSVEIVTKEGVRVVAVYNDDDKQEYKVPADTRIVVHTGDKVLKGSMLTEGIISPHDILSILGVQAVQEFLLEEVQKVYRGQGVTINDKHVEIILRQMTRKVKIIDMGDSKLLPGELIDVVEFQKENENLIKAGKAPSIGERVLLGITKASLNTESFISAASFQETAKVLTEAAIKGKIDEMYGLKENVIIGKLIPAGTGYYTNKPIELIPQVVLTKKEPMELEA